jgi:uncharacterized protein YjiS (DUF1127 family)
MAPDLATENLRYLAHVENKTPRQSRLLGLLLRLESWLDRRAGRRALYRLDDRALSDIGLTRADLDRPEPAGGWQRHLIGPRS